QERLNMIPPNRMGVLSSCHCSGADSLNRGFVELEEGRLFPLDLVLEFLPNIREPEVWGALPAFLGQRLDLGDNRLYEAVMHPFKDGWDRPEPLAIERIKNTHGTRKKKGERRLDCDGMSALPSWAITIMH